MELSGEVFLARRREAELTTTLLTEGMVRDPDEQKLRLSGRRVDLSSLFVDAPLPGGERLHVAIPDVTRTDWAVNVRGYIVRRQPPQRPGGPRVADACRCSVLAASVMAALDILVSAPTQAGKTAVPLDGLLAAGRRGLAWTHAAASARRARAAADVGADDALVAACAAAAGG